MRIAIYSGTFVKNQDGVARVLHRLVRSLLEKGHEVLMITPQYTFQNHPGLSFFKVPSIPLIISPDYRMSLPSGKVIRTLNRFQPDIIQVSTPDCVGLQVIHYARLKHIPITTIYHTNFADYMKYFHLGFLEKTVWQAIINVYNSTDRVYVPTEKFKSILQKKGAKSVGVWSRGIDRVKFNPIHRVPQLRKKWNADQKKVIVYASSSL